VLDDLQWADAASLDLMQALVTDRETVGLTVVGTYRSEQVNRSPLLSTVLRELENKVADDDKLGITKMELGNLTTSQVNDMLVDLLDVPEAKDTADLATLVHRKTAGNIFSVIQFLKSLNADKLLDFNIGALKWTWNVAEISLSATATDNVVDLLKASLLKLRTGVSRILPLVACLGATFRGRILDLVVEHFNQKLFEDPREALSPDELLRVCHDEGLIFETGSDAFRWEHDKVQEAALSLADPHELSSLRYQLGELLLDRLDQAELESNIFIIVNLLDENGASIACNNPKRVMLAYLNLTAGTKAKKSSAMASASVYLARGIQLLPSDHWETHYKLCLDLYSSAAEVYFCIEKFDEMRACCEEVFAQEQHPLADKGRAYNALLESKTAERCPEDARNKCLEILERFDCRFPKRGLAFFTLASIVRTRMTLSTITEKIPNLPMMKDETNIWTMLLLDSLVTASYQTKSDYFALAVFKGLRYTLDFGICDFTPPILATVGLLLAVGAGDCKGGKQFAEIALALFEDTSISRQSHSRTIFITGMLVLHFQTPYEQCRKLLLQGYQIGVAWGDSESAVWSIYSYLETGLLLGVPIDSLRADCSVYSKQTVTQGSPHYSVLCMWQFLLNMSGHCDDPAVLNGDVIDLEDTMDENERTNNIHGRAVLDRWRIFAAFWSGDYERTVNLIVETRAHKGFFDEVLPGTGFNYSVYSYGALAAISMFQKTRRGRYKIMAKWFSKKITEAAAKGVSTIGRVYEKVDHTQHG
jgi:predicted ATPase